MFSAKGRILVLYLIFTSRLLAYEGGSFAENHYRFIAQHLLKLINGDSGKVLLIGSFDQTYQMLSKQYPLIEFQELCAWNKKSWEEIIEKKHLYGFFDCVVVMHVLEREPAREKILRIISDLLRPGNGKLLIYLDPQEEDSLDQRVEFHVRHSEWYKRVPIIPSLSINECKIIIEDAGLFVLDQSHAQYLIYYSCRFSALLSLLDLVCSRWPVPRTDWDEEVFAGEIRDCLKSQYKIIKTPDSLPDYHSWIEDVLSTYYFIAKKR